MERAAVGFRIKSGWAAAALVAGTPAAPVLLDVTTIDLANPAVPDSTQPYHAALEIHAHADDGTVARLVDVVEQFAAGSLTELLGRYGTRGRLVGAGLVVGSVIDPSTIANDHIRAHAEEGRLFRAVVSRAAEQAGLKVALHVEKRLFDEAALALRRSTEQLKKDLVALGRGHDGPWRADEKQAALAAWMALGR